MNKGFKEFLFEDVVSKNKGFLRGPFGGSLKKEIFVSKGKNTYKVYEQGVVLRKNIEIGDYYIKEEYFNQTMYRFEVCPRDFLVSCSGANYGAIFQMPESIEKGIINQALLRIRLNNKLIDDSYFDYFFSHHLVNQIIGKKGDSTIPNFPPVSVLKKLKIKIHSDVGHQKQIAKVLSDLDAKIEVNNKINQELEAMAKTLYDYWFVQFDFPDANGKPYKSSGGKMVFNEALNRDIPEGWEDGVLTDIANITMGQSPSGSSYNEDGIGIVFYQGSTDFGSRFPTVRKYTTEPSRMAEENDILLSVRAPVGTLNQAMESCCIGRGLAALREKEGSISFLWSQMEYFKQIFDRRNSSGTTFGSITKDDLFNLKLCIPNKEVLEKFKKIVDPFHAKIVVNSKENQKLSELRDWLLPMLMNGQVRVAHSHADENLGAVEQELDMVAEDSGKYDI
ncbi:restriction endonuclease subunit S [Formosa algae]|uniref:restriction endonuclease subunit S n=1 Tax=Formosa algae TaxID=225843 RepID=UPI000CCE34D6|nr:restriction endonuclease subunit S [Formosa algae]PNW27301.1 hypothetical protein BKP44_13705 [Formosa algae]